MHQQLHACCSHLYILDVSSVLFNVVNIIIITSSKLYNQQHTIIIIWKMFQCIESEINNFALEECVVHNIISKVYRYTSNK